MAGISRLSTAKDLAKLFGVPEASGGEERFAAGKVTARYSAGGTLEVLRVEKDGVVALKKSGLLSNLEQSLKVWTKRLGPADESSPSGAVWNVPSSLAPMYRWQIYCSAGGSCDALTLTFPSE